MLGLPADTLELVRQRKRAACVDTLVRELSVRQDTAEVAADATGCSVEDAMLVLTGSEPCGPPRPVEVTRCGRLRGHCWQWVLLADLSSAFISCH
jgi:hypothetical protein